MEQLQTLRIAIVGYGEVGSIFAAALAPSVGTVTAFDVKSRDATWREAAAARARGDRVTLVERLEAATRDSSLVFSAVTAAQTLDASRRIAAAGVKGALVVDLNSASPRTKGDCAALVHDAGGRYVEAAVLGAVPPHGLRVPMLLGGPHAAGAQPLLARLGLDAQVGSATFGTVSAIKLCRSIVVKGMEALAVESLLAARRHGVETEVLASLAESFPGMEWERQAGYFWKRVLQHGRRRAEEMREAAAMVADEGAEPRMASATADLQAWIAQLKAEGAFEGVEAEAGWRAMADRIPRDEP